MGVNRLPKTVTRQRRGCDLNPGRTAPESSTLPLGYRARLYRPRSTVWRLSGHSLFVVNLVHWTQGSH